MFRLLIFFLFISLCSVAQEIAITFDDAPTPDGALFTGPERSRRIVRTLKRHNVKEAAFFVLTNNISDHTRDRLRMYTRNGHLLGNHSHTHQGIHILGTRAYIEDVAKADSILRSYPGYTKWFRYPFLDEGRTVSARDSIRHAIKEMDLQNGYVTVDNYDWYLNSLVKQAKEAGKKINIDILREIYVGHISGSIAFYEQVAQKHLGRSPKHVLLLHENDLAALFLGDLIAHLRKKGWKIISARDAYADPIASEVPDVLFNGQGRIAAIAREKGVAPRQLVQESEDEEYLTNLVNARKVFE